MKDLLTYLAKAMVDHPDEVRVSEKTLDDGTLELSLKVHNDDMGRIIGRSGKTARALRRMLSARGAMDNIKTQVEIIEDK
ncbi:MAG: KH domain-containing protein [bacterium]|nr:KH domain-containing protein [bacterium]